MGDTLLQVESRIIDGNPQLAKLDPVSVRLTDVRISVQDLIRRVVEEQLWDLLSRRKLGEAEARRILERQYLTQDQVQAQATHGAVKYPRQPSRAPQIDVEAEVQRATQAFTDGAYFLVVNGRQVTSLDEGLSLAATSKVTFLRLTPLIGG